MKKIIVTLFVLMMTAMCIVVRADAYVSRLVDSAGLLSGEEYDRVLYELDRVSQNHGMDIVVVTADTFEYGYNAKDEATEIYEMSGYGQDGIMLYLCMDTRDCRILTTGFGIEALNDEGIVSDIIFRDTPTPLILKSLRLVFRMFMLLLWLVEKGLAYIRTPRFFRSRSFQLGM